MHPKKIVIVIGNLELGGAENHIANIFPVLVNLGWSIECIVLGTKGVLSPLLIQNGIKVTPLTNDGTEEILNKIPRLLGRRAVKFLFHLTKLTLVLFKLEKNCILHLFLPHAYLIGTLAAIITNFKGPVIMSRRSLNNYQRNILGFAWCEKQLHRWISIASGNSQAIINQLLEEGIPANKLRLIYNGVNCDKFTSAKTRAQSRNLLGISDSALVLIIVANLIPYKGHLDLINALGNIKNNLHQEWRLLCVGRDDGILNNLKHSAKQQEIDQHVLWLGSRVDVNDLLAAADIGMLCSHQEGFSNAIIECMAAGLPMVVTDVGGNKEAVINGETGYVVPPQDPAALGNAILDLSNYPEKIKQFGHAGQQRAQQNFSLTSCVNSYVDLYNSCFEDY